MKPRVSVVIVTFNSAAEVATCIRAVQREFASRDYRLIVVDNASDDETLSVVRCAASEALVIENADNAGFSRASNQALEMADGAYVLFLNPDTELLPGSGFLLSEFLDAKPEYAAAGPALINPDGSIWNVSARRLPTLWSEFCQLTHLDRWGRPSVIFGSKYYAPFDRTSDRDVECLSGAALLCRTEQVRRLGGFDEFVPLYLDDMDLCARLGREGRLRYVAAAKVFHWHNMSGKSHSPVLLRRIGYQATYQFMKKHRGQLVASIYRVVVAAVGVMTMIMSPLLSLLGRSVAATMAQRVAVAAFSWVISDPRKRIFLPEAKTLRPSASTKRGA